MDWIYLVLRVVVLSGVFVGFLTGLTSNDAERRAYSLARWAGMGAEVEFVYVVTPDPHGIGGGFMAPGTYCSLFGCLTVDQPVVMIGAGALVPSVISDFIVLHEVGHYQQWRDLGVERMMASDALALEWDADRRAVNMLCHLGRDGHRVIQDFFAWAATYYDYHGDPTHGSARDREAHAVAASTHCRVRHEAA